MRKEILGMLNTHTYVTSIAWVGFRGAFRNLQMSISSKVFEAGGNKGIEAMRALCH